MRHDLPVSLAAAPGPVWLGDPLGPHPLLAEAQAARLRVAGAVPGRPVVMVAAGSQDPTARPDLDEAARLLASAWGGPVTLATLSGPGPRPAEVVTPAHAVSPYLLAGATSPSAVGPRPLAPSAWPTSSACTRPWSSSSRRASSRSPGTRVGLGHHPVEHRRRLQPRRARTSAASSTRLQPITLRKMSPSLPARPTAAAAMARFCGLIILPSTPPEEFEPAISTGSSPAWPAVCTWSAPNSAFDEVSEPVTATPSQPRIGDRIAKAPPAPASQAPRERGLAGEVHHVGQREDRHHGDDRGAAARRRSCRRCAPPRPATPAGSAR